MATRAKKVSGNQRFYQLIHEVTALLVGAKTEEIDILVDDCLGKVGEFFQVSQVGLGQWSKTGKILPSLRAWGPRPVSVYLETAGPGPEAFAFLCHKGSITWNCFEDLEELPQLQQHLRQVGAMAGVFCLYRDHGSHTEHLVMARDNEAVWPEDTVECLNAVGEVLYTALYRRRAEIEMERLRQLEQTVGSIASEFVHMLPARINEEIEKSLGRICECVDADISALLQRKDSEGLTMKVSHEWDTGSIDEPLFHGTILENDYPWLATQLRQSEPLLIDNPGDFPAAADAERAACERIGVRSMLWIPFTDADGQHGHIMFGTINRPGSWLEGARPQLGLVGNVLTSAIERQRIELEYERKSKPPLAKLNSSAEAMPCKPLSIRFNRWQAQTRPFYF
jgi:GAF domain-containing protein